MSLSEISVSNLAVSVSVTSTLYRGRTTLISRSGDLRHDIRDMQNHGDHDQRGTREDTLVMFYSL